MAMSDELARLGELHQRGVLSDEEFTTAKARVIAGAQGGHAPGPALNAVNSFQRSLANRWLGGVCGGLERSTGVVAWVWRLSFVLLVLCAGTGVLLYLLMWLLVPEEPRPAAALPMDARSA